MGLFDRALASEREELAGLFRAVESAKATTEEHRQQRDDLESERFRAKTAVAESARAAFLNGKAKPPETRSVAELDKLIEGAAEVIEDDEKKEAEVLGALQHRAIEMAKAWAERAAQGYSLHAMQLANDHALIGAAEKFVKALTGQPGNVADAAVWNRLYVPGAQSLAALRDRGFEIDAHWHIRTLAGGDNSVCSNAAAVEADSLEADLRSLFGGKWPFKRSASGDASTAHYAAAGAARAAQEDATRKSRRSVLEQAAEGITP